jgi:hypothetical protein
MFRRITQQWRVRFAVIVAASYVFVSLMPSAALAFTDNQAAIHCFGITQNQYLGAHTPRQASNSATDRYAVNLVHSHALHKHAAPAEKPADGIIPGDTQAQPAQCCGLFCVSGITQAFALTSVRVSHVSCHVTPVTGYLSGKYPDRIDRPPRSPMSI